MAPTDESSWPVETAGIASWLFTSVNSTFSPCALKKPFSCAMYSGASVATCWVPAFQVTSPLAAGLAGCELAGFADAAALAAGLAAGEFAADWAEGAAVPPQLTKRSAKPTAASSSRFMVRPFYGRRAPSHEAYNAA